MTPQNMWDLHCKIEELLARDDVAGVVVTHGTDTLEETSFFLDITAKSQSLWFARRQCAVQAI